MKPRANHDGGLAANLGPRTTDHGQTARGFIFRSLGRLISVFSSTLAVAVRGARSRLTRSDPGANLARLVRRARGRGLAVDHRFIESVGGRLSASGARRTYEALWNAYLRDAYPIFDNLTWPGRIPFLALTSGTTEGATKFIPVSAEMAASNRKAARTALAYFLATQPESRLFHGRLFFLGGSTDLNVPPRRSGGRPERHCGRRAVAVLRPYTFPPLDWLSKPTGTASFPSWPSGASRNGLRW